jgi:hypothetical protein
MKKMKNKSKKRIYTIEVIAFLETHREWEASASNDSDPVISFSVGPPKRIEQDGRTVVVRDEPLPNVFEVREAFFAIRDVNQAVEFFRKYGPWAVADERTQEAAPISLSALERQRSFFEDALLTREIWSVKRATNDDELRTALGDWYLWQNLPMELVFGPARAGLVRCKDVQEALRASVFLDRFDREPLRRCARPDCGKFFKQGNKQAKLYCSTQCAHLQSVRKYNQNKKNREATGGPGEP